MQDRRLHLSCRVVGNLLENTTEGEKSELNLSENRKWAKSQISGRSKGISSHCHSELEDETNKKKKGSTTVSLSKKKKNRGSLMCSFQGMGG